MKQSSIKISQQSNLSNERQNITNSKIFPQSLELNQSDFNSSKIPKNNIHNKSDSRFRETISIKYNAKQQNNRYNNRNMTQNLKNFSQSMKIIIQNAPIKNLSSILQENYQKNSQKTNVDNILSELNESINNTIIHEQKGEISQNNIKEINKQEVKQVNIPLISNYQNLPNVDIIFTDAYDKCQTYHFQAEILERIRVRYKQAQMQFNLQKVAQDWMKNMQMYSQLAFQHYLPYYKKILLGQKLFVKTQSTQSTISQITATNQNQKQNLSQQQILNKKNLIVSQSEQNKYAEQTNQNQKDKILIQQIDFEILLDRIKSQQPDKQIDLTKKKEKNSLDQEIMILNKQISQDLSGKREKINSLIAIFSGPLDIISTRFRKVSQDQLKQIEIKQNGSYYTLDFSNWYINKLQLLIFDQQTAWDMVVIIQFLKCDIDDDTMRCMIKKLYLFPQLRRLNCEQNKISQIPKHYLQTLKNKTKLIQLNLKNNPLTNQSIKNIEQFLQENKSIEIQYNKTSPQTQVINENSDDDDDMDNDDDNDKSSQKFDDDDDQFDKILKKTYNIKKYNQSSDDDDYQKRDML